MFFNALRSLVHEPKAALALSVLLTASVLGATASMLDAPQQQEHREMSAAAVGAADAGFSYVQSGGDVYFQSSRVEGADVRTFSELSCGYAKDRAHVYYLGAAIPEMAPESLELISCRPPLIRNAEGVFWRTKRIIAANPLTFSLLTDRPQGYAKDEDTVFYFDAGTPGQDDGFIRVAPNAEVYTFSMPYAYPEYGRDAFAVYFQGYQLIEVDTQSFEVLSSEYARDEMRVFYRGRSFNEADPASFRVSNAEGYDAEDDYHYFNNGAIVEP